MVIFKANFPNFCPHIPIPQLLQNVPTTKIHFHGHLALSILGVGTLQFPSHLTISLSVSLSSESLLLFCPSHLVPLNRLVFSCIFYFIILFLTASFLFRVINEAPVTIWVSFLFLFYFLSFFPFPFIIPFVFQALSLFKFPYAIYPMPWSPYGAHVFPPFTASMHKWWNFISFYW